MPRRRHALSGINALRRVLYKTAKLLGDVNAVARGKVVRRIGIRIVGKGFGRTLGRIFRSWKF